MKINLRFLIIRVLWIFGRHSSTDRFLADFLNQCWKTLNSFLIFFLYGTLLTSAQYRINEMLHFKHFIICDPQNRLRYSSYLFDNWIDWINLLRKCPSRSQTYTFWRDATKSVPLRFFFFLLWSELIFLNIEDIGGHKNLLINLNAFLIVGTWFLFRRSMNSDDGFKLQ